MDNKLVTSLHRKKTFSGVYMNYNSFFIFKVQERLNSHSSIPSIQYVCWLQYVSQWISIFKVSNSFPLVFIHNCIKRFLDKLLITRKTSGSVSDKSSLQIQVQHLQWCLLWRNKTPPSGTPKHLGKSTLTEKPSKYNGKDATTITKHCHQNNHQADSSYFTLIGSASDNSHLKLKESLLILKLKPWLNVGKESMSSYLFDIDALTLVNTQFKLP